MTTTRTITNPADWKVGDSVVVTHKDGAVTTGTLSEEFGCLYVGEANVRFRSGATRTDATVTVTREVETPPEPTGLGAVAVFAKAGAWVHIGRGRWVRPGYVERTWSEAVADFGPAVKVPSPGVVPEWEAAK